MNDNNTVLWIGIRHESAGFSSILKKGGYTLITADDLTSGLATLRAQDIDLIVLENQISCVQGELAAVRLKSAAPRVPILLLCEPLESDTPQAFFVNLILGLKAAPDLLLRAVNTLAPLRTARRTGS